MLPFVVVAVKSTSMPLWVRDVSNLFTVTVAEPDDGRAVMGYFVSVIMQLPLIFIMLLSG